MLGCGAPDYSKVISIKPESTLVEGWLDVRFHHGAPSREIWTLANAPLGVTSMVPILGKGMIYGGYCTSLGTANQETDAFSIEVDGQILYQHSFKGMAEWKLNTPSSGALYLLQNDIVAFRHSLAIMPGITFESGFLLRYTEMTGGTPNIASLVNYAIIAT